MAKADAFLKLDGVKGESNDSKHSGEIEIQSFSWGMSQQGAHGAGGGGGTGKVNVHDITVTKLVDASSPALAYHCASGKHIPKGLITVRKAGEKPVEYLKIKLEDILISGVNFGGHGHDVNENVSINFAKFWVEYTPQKPDGSPGSTDTMGWDVNKNVKL